MNYNFANNEIIQVGTMYCIGRNYADHAKEMGVEVPGEPIVFLKPPSAYVNSGSTVRLPSISNEVHHEVELVAVIGKDCMNVRKEEAIDVIEGYAVGIDLTLRDVQSRAKKKGHPWAVAKGFSGSAPISQVIPASGIKDDIIDFDLELQVNGITKQKGNTAFMQRPLAELIEYLSSIFDLRRGDCIFTGTPEGVGPVKSGDEVTAYLGELARLNINIE